MPAGVLLLHLWVLFCGGLPHGADHHRGGSCVLRTTPGGEFHNPPFHPSGSLMVDRLGRNALPNPLAVISV